MVKVTIICAANKNFYRVGHVNVRSSGDVYFYNSAYELDSHTSRHKDGNAHIKSNKMGYEHKIGKLIPTKELDKLEHWGTWCFGIESVHELYKEFDFSDTEGIFTINMELYKDKSFNLCFCLIGRNGLQDFYSCWKIYPIAQLYVFAGCHPMIGIAAIDASTSANKK